MDDGVVLMVGFFTIVVPLLAFLSVRLFNNVIKFFMLFLTLVLCLLVPSVIKRLFVDASVGSSVMGLLSNSYVIMVWSLVLTLLYFIVYSLWKLFVPGKKDVGGD